MLWKMEAKCLLEVHLRSASSSSSCWYFWTSGSINDKSMLSPHVHLVWKPRAERNKYWVDRGVWGSWRYTWYTIPWKTWTVASSEAEANRGNVLWNATDRKACLWYLIALYGLLDRSKSNHANLLSCSKADTVPFLVWRLQKPRISNLCWGLGEGNQTWTRSLISLLLYHGNHAMPY